MRLPARFVTLKETPLTEHLADTLEKKTVGVVAGSVHQVIFADYFPKRHWVGYPSRDLLLKDLQAKRLTPYSVTGRIYPSGSAALSR